MTIDCISVVMTQRNLTEYVEIFGAFLPVCKVRGPKAGKKDGTNLFNIQEQNSHSPVAQAVAYSVYLMFNPALHSMNICVTLRGPGLCGFCLNAVYTPQIRTKYEY
jgi:hypothetical protein